VEAIVDFSRTGEQPGIALGAAAVTVALIAYRYCWRQIDLFMQTLALGLLMTALTTFVGRMMFETTRGEDMGRYLMMAILLTAEGAAVIAWIRRELRRAKRIVEASVAAP
jgi:hypothetical protein